MPQWEKEELSVAQREEDLMSIEILTIRVSTAPKVPALPISVSSVLLHRDSFRTSRPATVPFHHSPYVLPESPMAWATNLQGTSLIPESLLRHPISHICESQCTNPAVLFIPTSIAGRCTSPLLSARTKAEHSLLRPLSNPASAMKAVTRLMSS